MGFASAVFGSKPSVPKLPGLDLTEEQGLAIEGNLQNLPAAQNLVNQANTFSREQITQMLQSIIPNYTQMNQTASENILAMEKGQLPKDVQDMIQNSAAARSLGYGTAGSGMARNLVARDLGLTSLALTEKGLSAAEAWIKMADQMYAPSMMNLSSMFVTPMQQMAFDVNERNLQYERQWLQSQIAAMPGPVASGIYNDIWGIVEGVAGTYGNAAAKGAAGGV